jgi:acetylornithine deacetylase/succinyl-diaminopimelate desuccinylase-like protein
MDAESSSTWNLRTIRQFARVLGAQSSWVGDIQGTARAQRVVRDMLERRGVTTETFHVPGTMPLVIAGAGPILLVTFLDDSNLTARLHDGSPPVVRDSIATAPGIIRKAGVLAALGALAGSATTELAVTLAIEADRHSGSVAMEHWLDRSGKRFTAALCEVVDLPIPTPAVFPSAAGRMIVKVTIERQRGDVEDTFGGVVSDLGHQIAALVASLKSLDSEIGIPGYYDSVLAPSSADIDALDDISAPIGDWLREVDDQNYEPLSDRHGSMAMFFAPSIVVRGINVADSSPFLPRFASATLDVRLTPGQHPQAVLRTIAERVRSISADGHVAASLVRPPVVGKLRDRLEPNRGVRVVPIAPGATPAGLLEERGTPTLGYAVVNRDAGANHESVDLNRVMSGSETIVSLATTLASQR